MSTPRKGTGRWVEWELLRIAEKLESDETYEPARAKAQIEAVKSAYEARLARASQIRNNEDPEEYLAQEDAPQLVDGRKVG